MNRDPGVDCPKCRETIWDVGGVLRCSDEECGWWVFIEDWWGDEITLKKKMPLVHYNESYPRVGKKL